MDPRPDRPSSGLPPQGPDPDSHPTPSAYYSPAPPPPHPNPHVEATMSGPAAGPPGSADYSPSPYGPPLPGSFSGPGPYPPGPPGGPRPVGPPGGMPMQQQSFEHPKPPAPALSPLVQDAPPDMRAVRTSAQFALREYLTLVKKRQRVDASTTSLDLEERIRIQGRQVVGDLRVLRQELSAVIKAAERHRWRRWLFGGILATFIPAIRHIFRRPSHDEDDEFHSSNDTEYAFHRSKSLLSRINESVLGKGGFASMAFFVFAVLFVFQNEVTLRVARTVSKRLKRLSLKLERGEQELVESDMKLLEGWRWRVLLFGR